MSKSDVSFGALFAGILKALFQAIGTLTLLVLSVIFKSIHVVSGKISEALENKLKN